MPRTSDDVKEDEWPVAKRAGEYGKMQYCEQE
jgi:hypothetical protein